MTVRHSLVAISGILLVLAAAGFYAYRQPHRALDNLIQASIRQDLSTVEGLVDLTAVRNDARDDLRARAVREAAKGNNEAWDGAALAASTRIDAFVERYLTPATISELFVEPVLNREALSKKGGEVIRLQSRPLSIATRYVDFSHFEAALKDSATKRTATLMFSRGSAGWKVISVRLPIPSNLE